MFGSVKNFEFHRNDLLLPSLLARWRCWKSASAWSRTTPPSHFWPQSCAWAPFTGWVGLGPFACAGAATLLIPRQRGNSSSSSATQKQGCAEPRASGPGYSPRRASTPPQGLQGVSTTPGFSFSWECASKVEMVRWNWNSYSDASCM